MSNVEQSHSRDPKNWIGQLNLEYLRSFPEIQLSGIGDPLGSGFYHNVFAYKDDWVLKVPRLYPGFSPYTAAERSHELAVMERYFPSRSIVETRIISNPHNPFYCFIQRRLNSYGYADKGDLDNAELQAIIEANRRLIEREHSTFDFFGFAGFTLAMQSLLHKSIKPLLTNIMTQTDESGVKQLHITDTTLYFFDKKHDPQASYKQAVAELALWWNNYLMKNFFGTDILPKILG